MPLGTLDRTPPPFFKQGMPALTKLLFFSALAFFLMVADTRFKVTLPLRAAMATVLHPVERMLLAPVRAWVAVHDYVGDHQEEGQRREEQQLGQGRHALLEEGRRGAVEGAERHRAGRVSAGGIGRPRRRAGGPPRAASGRYRPPAHGGRANPLTPR